MPMVYLVLQSLESITSSTGTSSKYFTKQASKQYSQGKMSEENIQLAEAVCKKQSPKENLKTETMGVFFAPNVQMGYFFSYNIHDEERKEIFTILHCLQASSAQVTVHLFVPLFL